MSERPTPEQIGHIRASDSACGADVSEERGYGAIYQHRRALLAEVDALRANPVVMVTLSAKPGAEPIAIGAMDAIAAIGADRDAAIARAVAAERRAETAELAWTELHRAAVSFEAPLSEWCDGPLRDALWKALAATPTGLAEALRRELRAEGMEMGADLLSARSETEGRHEVINAPVSRGVYSIDLAEEAALLRQRAAELRGPK